MSRSTSRYLRALDCGLFLLSGATWLSACGETRPEQPADDFTPEPALGTVQQASVVDRIDGLALPPRRISLTYDDGPGRNTLAIAQYLASQGVRATFFVTGCRFQGAPQPIPEAHETCNATHQPIANRVPASYLAQLTALGHRIANHFQDHAKMGNRANPPLPSATIRQQLRTTHDIIAPHIPDGLLTLRPPHNDWNALVRDSVNAEVPGYLGPFYTDFTPTMTDSACLECTQESVNYPVGNCASSSVQTAASCADQYINLIGNSDRGILMLHDRQWTTELAGGPTQTTDTLDLTQRLISNLLGRGFVFVPLDAIPGVLGPYQMSPQTLWTSQYSNALSWNLDPSYYLSIRFADIDGDNDADVCGRGSGGIWCAQSTGTGFINAKFWLTSNFADAHGWKEVRYGPTIQLADIDGDGDADICGRGSQGIYCSKSLAKQGTASFDSSTLWSNTGDFSNAQGWDSQPSYYLSIRLADVDGDGKADVCGRHAAGVWCAISTGIAFQKKTLWLSQDFGDVQGYLPEYYGATLMLGDLNGDSRADVCARANQGIRCGLAKSASPGFDNTTLWLPDAFSNDEDWASSAAKYRTVQLADVNGDNRADVCGRNDTGIVCAFASNGRFRNYLHLRNDDFTDADAWGNAQYGQSVRFADIDGNGLADACGRGNAGIYCSTAVEALRGKL